MTLKMTDRQFKRLTKNIVPAGMSKSDMMTLHLLIVEAVHGRLSRDELRSARFTESRDQFVELFQSWKKANEK